MEVGALFLEGVLAIANLLVSPGAPGYVGIAMFVALAAAIWTYWQRSSRRERAVLELRDAVLAFGDIPSFARGFDEFRSNLLEFKEKSEDHKVIWDAWDEYRETIVLDDIDGVPQLRNSVRPANFLNIEDLGFGPGIFRNVPGTFVSFGLLCTFLGLVAALSQLGTNLDTGASPDTVVIGLMNIAAAKFTMSLVGLFCSIIFGLVLRRRQVSLDRAVHRLCHGIERRLVFVSLEDLGFRQLRAAEEQREHLRKIGMEMVAELSRPLNELPKEITSSISSAMEPMFEQVNRIGASSMEGIVGDLSSQISHSVGSALTRASDSLTEASDRISQMVDRLNGSSDRMGAGMENAVGQMTSAVADLKIHLESTGQTATNTMNEGADRLLAVMNETLEGIRENTGQGARAISEAAQEMKSAAEGFRNELSAATSDGASAVAARMSEASSHADEAISAAGKSMLDAFGKTSSEIAKLGEDMGERVGSEITSRVENLAEALEKLVGTVSDSADGIRSIATNLKSGTENIATASTSFGGASRDLIAAIEPVRISHENIKDSVSSLSRSIETSSLLVSSSSERVAKDAADVLETARSALGNEREGIRQSLEATRHTLAQLSEEAAKLDGIDEMLGRAISDYSSQLETALGSAQSYVEDMHNTLAPGIDTLRSVVERAETFMPQSRRA